MDHLVWCKKPRKFFLQTWQSHLIAKQNHVSFPLGFLSFHESRQKMLEIYFLALINKFEYLDYLLMLDCVVKFSQK